MTLEEYNKHMEEKRAALNLNTKKPSGEAKADPKAFEGMQAYSGKKEEVPSPTPTALTREGTSRRHMASDNRRQACTYVWTAGVEAPALEASLEDPLAETWDSHSVQDVQGQED